MFARGCAGKGAFRCVCVQVVSGRPMLLCTLLMEFEETLNLAKSMGGVGVCGCGGGVACGKGVLYAYPEPIVSFTHTRTSLDLKYPTPHLGIRLAEIKQESFTIYPTDNNK